MTYFPAMSSITQPPKLQVWWKHPHNGRNAGSVHLPLHRIVSNNIFFSKWKLLMFTDIVLSLVSFRFLFVFGSMHDKMQDDWIWSVRLVQQQSQL